LSGDDEIQYTLFALFKGSGLKPQASSNRRATLGHRPKDHFKEYWTIAKAAEAAIRPTTIRIILSVKDKRSQNDLDFIL
jgi:hypothetical protein